VQYSQNFLHNRKLVANLVQRTGIDEHDVVLEIGPGRGIITRELAEHSAHVLAIEKDPVSTRHLQQRFNGVGNVTVFAADFLDFPLPATAFKVFSNIPYNITAAIVGKLTTGVAPPLDTWLVLQREAAAKLTGQPRQTLTSLKLMPLFDLSIEHTFRRTDFRPTPAVDSVLLRIHKRTNSLVSDPEIDRFHDFVTAVFTAWKPNLREALQNVLPVEVVKDLDHALTEWLLAKPGDVPAHVWITAFQHLARPGIESHWRKIDGASHRLAHQQGTLKKDHRSRTSGRR
jgi:23S rRNA (adenine-N6)-dimethyltransferase